MSDYENMIERAESALNEVGSIDPVDDDIAGLIGLAEAKIEQAIGLAKERS